MRRINSWQDDSAWFVSTTYPWFVHGGDYLHGTEGGIFNFSHTRGSATTNNSFRIILAM